MAKAELTPKQHRFVEEFLIDLNATQAAIRAGYSEKTAQQQGARLLSNVVVAEAVAEGQRALRDKSGVTAERVILELARIGFADIRKAVRWDDAVVPVPSHEIDDDTAAAIAEVSLTASGPKVKLFDKRAALVDLGKHLGLFTDRVDVTTGGEPLREFTDMDRAKAILAVVRKATDGAAQ